MSVIRKGKIQPVNWRWRMLNASRSQSESQDVTPNCAANIDANIIPNWILWDARSLKDSSHLQHGEQGNFLPSAALAAKQRGPLDLQEQFSVRFPAVRTYSKSKDSIHHAECMLVLKILPNLSTPASPKSYYTQAHATGERKGCCFQNVKQINWLPSNIPFFFQDDPGYWKS